MKNIRRSDAPGRSFDKTLIHCSATQWTSVKRSTPPMRVARALDQIIEWRGKPPAIRCDNGPEHINQIFAYGAAEQSVRLEFI